jgi:methylase of polypeptide subunit release factors
MFNKKLNQLTDQEREQIKTKVLERRAARPQQVTDKMRQMYGRDGWS